MPLLAMLLLAQTPAPDGFAAVTGTDTASGISYALIPLEGKRIGAPDTSGKPKLTAQCTKAPTGKVRFELLADAGDVPELRYIAPWKPISKDDIFPPVVPKATVTMEFLGYTKVKPMKRQWTGLDGLPGEWKYATPGLGSANMEDASYFMQYLKALPTLRLTFPSPGLSKPPFILEFETARWQQRVKAEPLCAASGL